MAIEKNMKSNNTEYRQPFPYMQNIDTIVDTNVTHNKA